MFQVDRVEIKGFWGSYSAAANFHPDINIFIGRNGTGKTTFMNLLQGVLNVDLGILMEYEFSEIKIKLVDDRKQRTIRVNKTSDSSIPFEVATFKISNKVFKLPLYARDIQMRHMYRHRRSVWDTYNELKEEIGQLVNLSSLSVHRTAYFPTYEGEYPESDKTRRPPIDLRLEELAQRLTSYQLELSDKANDISSDFQQQVLASILYDSKFDKFDLNRDIGVELSKEKDQLRQAFEELGALDSNTSKRIDTHISELNKSLNALNALNSPLAEEDTRRRFNVHDFMPLPLLGRTQHIINLSLTASNQKEEVFKPIRDYVAIVREFISDKKFIISTNGEMIVERGDKRISIMQLSSGEKQLLILLTETLLQRNRFYIFMADEPELSLHIEWQAKIVAAIKRLNSKTQVIVATHSPEIAGGWKNRVIDMEEVVNG